MPPLKKYPRTPHLQGSKLQPGDEDLDQVPFADLAGRHLVVEEKIDGANAAVCFDARGALHLQSRGHYLTGGVRERQFDRFKGWAAALAEDLFIALEDRYVLFGEWLFAKHTVFYDRLPHYFLAFDVFDRRDETFLATPRWRALLAGLPVVPVPVLHEGPVGSPDELAALVGPALYKSDRWRERLAEVARALGLDAGRVMRETDSSDLAEGLYVKVEEGDAVAGRYKFIRPSFVNAVLDSGSHWLARPIVPNQLADGTDLFGGAP